MTDALGTGGFEPASAPAERRAQFDLRRRLVAAETNIATNAADLVSLVDSRGTYTPTLTGMAVGTGGFAGATVRWVFHGGPDVGDYGTLTMNIFITYGTSGQTFPTNPTISLPSGFEFQDSNSNVAIGNCFLVDNSTGANSRAGTLFQGATAGVMRPLIDTRAAAPATLTTTTPFTWASSDGIYGTATAIAKRV